MSRRTEPVDDRDYDEREFRHPAGRQSGTSVIPIAIAIIIAGGLIAGGIVAAVLFQRGSLDGVGTTSTPSPPVPGATIATSGGSPAASAVAPAVSVGPEGEAGGHLNFPLTRAECPHDPGLQAPPDELLPEMVAVFHAAHTSGGQTHSCTVSIGAGLNIYVSYHKLGTLDEMTAAWEAASQGYDTSGSVLCEDSFIAGYGPYHFEDGRVGTALCNRTADLVFIAWTEENTNVISSAYARLTDDPTVEALRAFWTSSTAGPVCRVAVDQPELRQIAECRGPDA